MNKLEKQDLKNRTTGLTVGKLKEFLEHYNVPDDALVMIERVQDSYYEGSDISGCGGCLTTEDGIYPPGSKAEGWRVYLKEGYVYKQCEEYNKRVDSGEFLDKKQFPNGHKLTRMSYEELEGMKIQYTPAWSCVKYKEDDDLLFIDLHY